MERFGISRRTFFNWRSGAIPATVVPKIEQITGVPRHELRNDLWQRPTDQAAA